MQQLDAMLDALKRHGHEPKKSGKAFVCLSPWTNEKTPSCHIYPKGNGWHFKCFSSGKQGDAIALLREFNMTFEEACEATGQTHKLQSTSTAPMRFRKRRTRVTPPPYTSTSTARTLQLRPSGQTTFVPGDVYTRFRDAANPIVNFLAEHCSVNLAFKVREQCICMGGDPQRSVINGAGVTAFIYIDMQGRAARIKVVPYSLQHDSRMIGGVTIKRTSAVRHVHQNFGVTDSEALLYGLPYVLRSDPCVFLVESEKTVELFRVKTCHSSIVATGGTLSINSLYPIKDKVIRWLPDMDKRDEAKQQASELRAQGLDVQVVDWWTDHAEALHAKDDVGDLVQMLTRPQCFDLVAGWRL